MNKAKFEKLVSKGSVYSMRINGLVYRAVVGFGEIPENKIKELAK
tara:strand:+ start:297 stop:431 length:135 start_codon:yes stop_codon:yes gene_type:complete